MLFPDLIFFIDMILNRFNQEQGYSCEFVKFLIETVQISLEKNLLIYAYLRHSLFKLIN